MVLIFDLDGVVYLGDTPIPGAIPALNRLKDGGHQIYFLTNNSTRHRSAYVSRLQCMGFETDVEHVMTSAFATGLYLKDLGAAGKTVYVVGEHGLAEEMEAAGLRVLSDADAASADYVVAGLDRTLTYAKLARAFKEIREHGARFIATNRDATYPMETGEIPGGGATVAPIEVSTGVTGVTIGKPESVCWERILALSGVPASQALMVGDRPETDIRGARRIGIPTALVMTGVTREADLDKLPPEHKADFVISNLEVLPDLIGRWGN